MRQDRIYRKASGNGLKDIYYILIPAVVTKKDVRSRNWKKIKKDLLRNVSNIHKLGLDELREDLTRR